MFLRAHLVDGHTPPFEYLPGTADEEFSVGEALVISSAGALTKCGATATPEYIAQGPAMEDGNVPVEAVRHGVTYLVPLQAAGTSLKLGSKVTLHTDGLQVTATTTNGVAKIVRMDGTAVGDTVGVQF